MRVVLDGWGEDLARPRWWLIDGQPTKWPCGDVVLCISFRIFNYSLTMKLPFSVLRPAAYLLLGASTIFGCSTANALSYNWSFINNGNPTSGGTTSGTITGLIEGINDISGGPGYNPNIVITVVDSVNTPDGNIFRSNDSFLRNGDITVASGLVSGYNFTIYNASSYLVFRDYQVAQVADNDGISFGYDTDFASNPVNFSAVPGPLPILGIPPVLLFSRRLKARIKARKEASIPALV